MAAAPVAGVIAAAGKSFPIPGGSVQVAQPLMILRPLLSPERDVLTPAETVQIAGTKATLVSALITAQGEVQRGESEVAGLIINRDRGKQLLADRAGSRRAFDDAEAQLNIAQAVLAAAKQRETELTSLIKSLEPSDNSGTHEPASPLTITAPVGGIIRSVNVSVDQTVNASAPLFEVVNLDSIWIRVPVYVGLLAGLETGQAATLVALEGGSLQSSEYSPGESPHFTAQPVAAPPTADAASSSADLYYEADNRVLQLRPGQRIGVDLTLTSVSEALIIPTSALLYDIYGGTWVYVQQSIAADGHTKYARNRVLLEWVDGQEAIVSQGPAIGELVVTDGAAELFGTEFGAGK